MSLPTRIFGKTGIEVTQLGYGAMEVRGERIWGGRPCNDQQAQRILEAVLDAGIDFIDTANDYGDSELYIGRYLAARREEFFLATKCGCHVQYDGARDATPHVFTRDNVLRNIASSLRQMRTDRVDLLQLHNPSVQAAEEGDMVAVLQELKKDGCVRFIGCSSTSPDLATYIDWGVFDAFQIPYCALQRQHEDLITKAGEAGAGVIVRGGVARGEPGSGQGGQDRWQLFEQAGLDELREADESRTAFLLRFTLSHPHCHSTIVGTMNPQHLAENVRIAGKGPLPEDVYAEAKKRLDAAGESPEAG